MRLLQYFKARDYLINKLQLNFEISTHMKISIHLLIKFQISYEMKSFEVFQI